MAFEGPTREPIWPGDNERVAVEPHLPLSRPGARPGGGATADRSWSPHDDLQPLQPLIAARAVDEHAGSLAAAGVLTQPAAAGVAGRRATNGIVAG